MILVNGFPIVQQPPMVLVQYQVGQTGIWITERVDIKVAQVFMKLCRPDLYRLLPDGVAQ